MKLDPQKTALLTLDLQKGVFGLVPGSERVMTMAAKAVAFARQNQFRIMLRCRSRGSPRFDRKGFSRAGLGRRDGRIHRRAKALIRKDRHGVMSRTHSEGLEARICSEMKSKES